MTGDITVDRRVRKIGGVIAKIRGATLDGVQVVGIPTENGGVVGDLLILESPRALIETQIFVLDTLDEAVALARVDRSETLRDAIAEFAGVQERLQGKRSGQGLKDPGIEEALARVVELAPHHFSARGLLQRIRGEAPRMLSLAGSIDQVLLRGGPALNAIGELRVGVRPTKDQIDAITRGSDGVRLLKSKVHKDAKRFQAAMSGYLSAARRMVKAKKPGLSSVKRLHKTGDTLVAEYRKLGDDKDILEALTRSSQ